MPKRRTLSCHSTDGPAAPQVSDPDEEEDEDDDDVEHIPLGDKVGVKGLRGHVGFLWGGGGAVTWFQYCRLSLWL